MLKNVEICDNLDLCLSELQRNLKVALNISRKHAYKSYSESQFEFYCFKEESIYEYALILLVRKDFPFLNELNGFIQMASSSGIIEKWHSNDQTRIHLKHKEKMFKQLKMINFIGLYCVWWILLILTFFTVIWERLVYEKVSSSNKSKFWIILEMAIDSVRHFWLENKWLK